MLYRPLTCAVCAALLIPFTGCDRSEASAKSAHAANADAEARVVHVMTAAEKETDRTIFANGTLAAHDQAGLSIKVAGRLEEIPVDVGSVVKSGDIIGQIQRRDYELKVQQAKAAVSAARARLGLPLDGTDDSIEVKDSSVVREARAQLDEQEKNRARIAKLHEQKILAESELESAEAAYQVALNKYEDALQETNNRKATLAQRRAQLNIAEQELADTVIRAPFDGVVQERKASPGEYLMEGAPLATVVRTDPIRLRLQVPEREALAVRRGQRVRFRVDGDTNSYSGQVDRVSPAIAQDNRMLQIEADIANDGRLRPGSFARADIVTANARAILLPRSAIVSFAGIEKVFVCENGKAAEHRVVTDPNNIDGAEVEIMKGVHAGDVVILDPNGLRASQPVSIAKQSNERAATPPNG